MNKSLKHWMTHPVLLGALMGIFFGSIYLLFYGNFEEEGDKGPANVAVIYDNNEEKVAAPNQALTSPEVIEQKASVQAAANSDLKEEEPLADLQQTKAVEKIEKLAKLEKKEKEPLASVASAHFTIQLLGASSEQNVKQFIKRHGLDSKAHYVRTKRAQKDWYVVCYGDFSSQEEAKAALLKMPATLQKENIRPWVKQVEKG